MYSSSLEIGATGVRWLQVANLRPYGLGYYDIAHVLRVMVWSFGMELMGDATDLLLKAYIDNVEGESVKHRDDYMLFSTFTHDGGEIRNLSIAILSRAINYHFVPE